jgi:hypothetical protein
MPPESVVPPKDSTAHPGIEAKPWLDAEEVEDDGAPFEEKMPLLVAELESQFAESAKLEAALRADLKSLDFTT